MKALSLRSRSARRNSGEGGDIRPKVQGLFTPGGLALMGGNDDSARAEDSALEEVEVRCVQDEPMHSARRGISL